MLTVVMALVLAGDRPLVSVAAAPAQERAVVLLSAELERLGFRVGRLMPSAEVSRGGQLQQVFGQQPAGRSVAPPRPVDDDVGPGLWSIGVQVDPLLGFYYQFSPSLMIVSGESNTLGGWGFNGGATMYNTAYTSLTFGVLDSARVSVSEKSSPSKNDSISRRVWCWVDRVRLAFSTSRRSFCRARLSVRMFLLVFFLYSLTK
jgi:hypothetical protein